MRVYLTYINLYKSIITYISRLRDIWVIRFCIFKIIILKSLLGFSHWYRNISSQTHIHWEIFNIVVVTHTVWLTVLVQRGILPPGVVDVIIRHHHSSFPQSLRTPHMCQTFLILKCPWRSLSFEDQIVPGTARPSRNSHHLNIIKIIQE